MRILLTGGGTGGHIIPFAPIIEALRTVFSERQESLPRFLEPKKLEIMFAGVVTPEATTLFSQYDVKATHIPSGKLRRYFSGVTIIDLLFRLPAGIFRALFVVWNIMPDVVISKGGYGSLPVLIAAAIYRIPVLLHESDSVAGVSNTLFGRLASGIALGYEAARETLGKHASKAVTTGNPVRGSLRQLTQTQAKQSLQVPAQEFVLLLVGGSQGAAQLNEALLAALPKLITNTTIIHVTGQNNFEAVKTVAGDLIAHSPRKDLYYVYPYLEDAQMIRAFVAADIIITRAGSTLAEIAAAKKPALIVPLDTSAGDHQRKNAQAFEAAGAALVLDPKNMGRNLFEQNIRRLRDDEALRTQLSENIGKLDFPRAARDVAELSLYLAQGFRPSA